MANFKKFFVYSLIGSLIISALVAVVTVLIGQFNEVTNRVFMTLFMVVIHSLVSLAFIWNDEKENTFEKLTFFTNVIFCLIIISFFTSIFGVWKIIGGETIWHLYQTYFIVAFASLHANILSKILKRESYMDMIIYFNFLFIFIVVLMLMPIIYMDNVKEIFGEMFYRILGAVSIIDGTLSVLTAIFLKLYTHKHPEIENPLQGQPSVEEKKKGLSIWVWILIIYLASQVLFTLFSFSGFRFF